MAGEGDGVLASAMELLEIAGLTTLLEGPESLRLFTEAERLFARSKFDPARRLAARLAAKRAAARLLGGGLDPEDFEVVRAAGSPPRMALSDRADRRLRDLGGARVLVSLTHGREHAAASVLVIAESP
jgi:phosphopantetheinyl transferase (holo-ACP synthase)